jgi:hypothetical protein
VAQETDRSARAALDELRRHRHGDELAKLVQALATSAFDERRASLDDGLDEAASRLGIDEVSAETSFGNVLRAARKGHQASTAERVMLGALLARGLALEPPASSDAEAKAARALLWLAAHTPVDATQALDDAAPELAPRLYDHMADALRRFDANGGAQGEGIDRASAVVAAASLARTPHGRAALEEVRGGLRDPLLAHLAAPALVVEPPARRLGGELTPWPRGSVWTLVLTLSLILPLVALARAFARRVLRLRRPVELELQGSTLTLKTRTELMGKTLREQVRVWDRSALARAGRELRFASLPTYVGIASLLIGSYVGLRLVLDGLRGGSPPYLAAGVGVLVLGLVVDWLSTRAPSRDPELCRLVLETHRGERVAIAGVDRRAADAALRDLSKGSTPAR